MNDAIVNEIDATNIESIKYCDKNNIDTMKNIFNLNKATLMRARSFQRHYTQCWNSNASEVSQMLYLELSKFDEISNDGCI